MNIFVAAAILHVTLEKFLFLSDIRENCVGGILRAVASIRLVRLGSSVVSSWWLPTAVPMIPALSEAQLRIAVLPEDGR